LTHHSVGLAALQASLLPETQENPTRVRSLHGQAGSFTRWMHFARDIVRDEGYDVSALEVSPSAG